MVTAFVIYIHMEILNVLNQSVYNKYVVNNDKKDHLQQLFGSCLVNDYKLFSLYKIPVSMEQTIELRTRL